MGFPNPQAIVKAQGEMLRSQPVIEDWKRVAVQRMLPGTNINDHVSH